MSSPYVILALNGVCKHFENRTVVHDVSFTLKEGERCVLLGHNGAGKTTLFKIILGFLQKDMGTISVLGHQPGSSIARAASAYLPEAVAFQKSLTGAEVMRFYARLKGEDPTKALTLLDRVDLAEAAGRRVQTYSKGMRQRLGLAQALIGRPRLVLLDEPTSGLDPISRQNFYQLVEDVAANGATVLLSSHALTEVEARTDRVLIVSRGRLVADDTLARLSKAAELPVKIKLRGQSDNLNEIASHLGGRCVNGQLVELVCASEQKMKCLEQISALGAMVDDVEINQPSLDDVYRHYSKLEIGEGGEC